MQRAIANKQPPFKYLMDKGFRAFSQIDLCLPQFGISIWPQVLTPLSAAACFPSPHLCIFHSLLCPLEMFSPTTNICAFEYFLHMNMHLLAYIFCPLWPLLKNIGFRL